jgi:hypothetical protein
MTNHPHLAEETEAFFSRNDRFDGFDRGDLDRDYAADQADYWEAELQDENAKAEVQQ